MQKRGYPCQKRPNILTNLHLIRTQKVSSKIMKSTGNTSNTVSQVVAIYFSCGSRLISFLHPSRIFFYQRIFNLQQCISTVPSTSTGWPDLFHQQLHIKENNSNICTLLSMLLTHHLLVNPQNRIPEMQLAKPSWRPFPWYFERKKKHVCLPSKI